MTYMTFKIKKDWLFYTLAGITAAANLVMLICLIVGAAQGNAQTIALSASMTVVLLLVNGYIIYCITKGYKVGLTESSIKVDDLSKLDIPYTTIRSIKKDREPSKYKLYDALLVIKYNQYDTVKINVDDLENCFDNIKELVQKSNVNRPIDDIVLESEGQPAPKAAPAPAPTPAAAPVAPAQPAAAKTTTTTTTTTTTAAKAAPAPAAKTTTTTTTAAKPAPAAKPATTTAAKPAPAAKPAAKPATTTTTTAAKPAAKKVTTTTTTKTTTAAQAADSKPVVTTSTVIQPDGTTKVVKTTTTTAAKPKE